MENKGDVGNSAIEEEQKCALLIVRRGASGWPQLEQRAPFGVKEILERNQIDETWRLERPRGRSI